MTLDILVLQTPAMYQVRTQPPDPRRTGRAQVGDMISPCHRHGKRLNWRQIQMHAAGSTAESAAGGDRGPLAAATSQRKHQACTMRSPGAALSRPPSPAPATIPCSGTFRCHSCVVLACVALMHIV